jgi:isopentenyl phosphate kinase
LTADESPDPEGYMMRVVIKIGGSFITRKSESDAFPSKLEDIRGRGKEFIEDGRLRSIASEIAQVHADHGIMLVHGAGPFGHALVKRIREGEGIRVGDVHQSMLVLNSAVMGALAEAGVPGVARCPFDFARFDGDYLTADLTSRMTRDLAKSLVPVSHGDLVPASASGSLGGYEVISGDVVARDLALAWPADRIVMVTDMDGILDRDPREGAGRTIDRLGYEECLRILKHRSPPGADVTGGIIQKIRDCRDPIFSGTPLQIISGLRPGHLASASRGEGAGTIIEAR